MFGLVRRLFGTSSTEESTSSELLNLPAGQLYLIRPKHSTKVQKECIYLEAALSIQVTKENFHYELVVERLTGEHEDLSSIEDDLHKAFLLDESVDFRVYEATDESDEEERSTLAFSWLDVSSPEVSERFEFLISSHHEGCSKSEIEQFESAVYQCIWERKNQKSSSDAPEDELTALELKSRQPPPEIGNPTQTSLILRSTRYESDDSEVEDSIQATSGLIADSDEHTEDGQSDSDADEIVNKLKGTTLANHPPKEPSSSTLSSAPAASHAQLYEKHSVLSPLRERPSNLKDGSVPRNSREGALPSSSVSSTPATTPVRLHGKSSVLSTHYQQETSPRAQKFLQDQVEHIHESSPPVSIYPTIPTDLSKSSPAHVKDDMTKSPSRANQRTPVIADAESTVTSPSITNRLQKSSKQQDFDIEHPEVSATIENGPPSDETVAVWAASCAIYVYDEITSHFKVQANNALAQLWVSAPHLTEHNICWLMVTSEVPETGEPFHWVSTNLGIEQDLCFEGGAIRFNYIYSHPDTNEEITSSWALRFPGDESLEQYTAAKDAFIKALYDRDHGQGSYDQQDRATKEWNRLAYGVADEEHTRESELDHDEQDEIEESEEEDVANSDDEDDNEQLQKFRAQQSGPKNSQLCVGTKEDLSFVLRGNMIGVFKNQPSTNTKLPFIGTVTDLSTPDGKRGLLPTKMMSHLQDTSLIIQEPTNPNSLYNLDLVVGKVVEEWKITKDAPVVDYVPRTKLSQMHAESTLVGTSRNSLFTIDPRLSGFKAVSNESKSYKTMTDFSCATTTANGEVALGSKTGEIRLYDSKIGKIAKTSLPSLNQPILGIDTTMDGKYMIVTCAKFLLFVDCQLDPDKGILGFHKSFPKANKPPMKRIDLTPEHRAQIMSERIPFIFTKAKFNQGPDVIEKTVVTSIGPYIITFELKKLKAGITEYNLKRYQETIVADNFRWGNDKDIVVTMPSDVFMEKKSKLSKPNRQSLVGGTVPYVSSKSHPPPTFGTESIVEEWDA